jgi:hypothetical protein
MADATDTLQNFITLFTSNWVAANTGGRTPSFIKKHQYSMIDLNRGDWVVFGFYGDREEDPDSFKWIAYDVDEFMFIDMLTNLSDDQGLLMKKEAIRVMNNLQFSSTTGFSQINRPKHVDRRDFHRKQYEWVLEYGLKKFHEALAT